MFVNDYPWVEFRDIDDISPTWPTGVPHSDVHLANAIFTALNEAGLNDIILDNKLVKEVNALLDAKSYQEAYQSLTEEHEYEEVLPFTWDEFVETGMPNQPDTPEPVEGVDYILEPNTNYD